MAWILSYRKTLLWELLPYHEEMEILYQHFRRDVDIRGSLRCIKDCHENGA